MGRAPHGTGWDVGRAAISALRSEPSPTNPLGAPPAGANQLLRTLAAADGRANEPWLPGIRSRRGEGRWDSVSESMDRRLPRRKNAVIGGMEVLAWGGEKKWFRSDFCSIPVGKRCCFAGFAEGWNRFPPPVRSPSFRHPYSWGILSR